MCPIGLLFSLYQVYMYYYMGMYDERYLSEIRMLFQQFSF